MRKPLVALLLTLAIASGCVHARPTGTVPPAKQTVTTDDGWPLAIHHYPVPEPAPGATPLPLRRRPILLVHGLATNHLSLDVVEGGSLARHLAAEGFDVWALDLRGKGASRPAPEGAKLSQRSFDDYVDHDAPAAIRYVLDQTGADGLAWVGHSMGGMIAYAHLGKGGTGVDALVAIGSPGSMRQHGMMRALAGLAPIAAVLPHVHMRAFGKFHANALRGTAAFHVDNYFFNRNNLTREERMLLGATALENLSRAEVKTFSTWTKKERFVSGDGTIDYAKNLDRITIPVLLVSGSADRIVPPRNVQFVMQRLASPDKTHRVFGRISGDERDWGHVDLVAGALAARTIFPEIAVWLDARDPAGCAPRIQAASSAAP